MSLSELTSCTAHEAAVQSSGNTDLYDATPNVAAALDAIIAAGEASSFPDDVVRELMAALVKIYATKFDDGQRPTLIDPDSGVSATAILMTTSALMKSSNLEIFELGMWQSWSGTR
jgi:hypothetical protein